MYQSSLQLDKMNLLKFSSLTTLTVKNCGAEDLTKKVWSVV